MAFRGKPCEGDSRQVHSHLGPHGEASKVALEASRAKDSKEQRAPKAAKVIPTVLWQDNFPDLPYFARLRQNLDWWKSHATRIPAKVASWVTPAGSWLYADIRQVDRGRAGAVAAVLSSTGRVEHSDGNQRREFSLPASTLTGEQGLLFVREEIQQASLVNQMNLKGKGVPQHQAPHWEGQCLIPDSSGGKHGSQRPALRRGFRLKTFPFGSSWRGKQGIFGGFQGKGFKGAKGGEGGKGKPNSPMAGKVSRFPCFARLRQNLGWLKSHASKAAVDLVMQGVPAPTYLPHHLSHGV